MFEHLISNSLLERFYSYLESIGITSVEPYSKGTTSIVFRGKLAWEEVLIKLRRPDSPRQNFGREADILRAIEPFEISPPLLGYGTFEGLEYIIRGFAEGEIILHADVQKRHVLEIAMKTALLDRLGLDHGQIQGGKHIIIGERVWLIDFEKANWRKPRNLTSAMAMIFLNDNVISKRIIDKFGLDDEFRAELRERLGEYKRSGRLSGVLSLLSDL